MLHAVIMAGGAGSRFWPESREVRPKQLLPLLGQRSMIRATVDRLAALVPPERMLVVTTQALQAAIASELPELPRECVLAEPCRRDTAGCIGLAAIEVAARDPDAMLVVLPADHIIEPADAFVGSLEQAARLVQAEPGRIATFGIRPSYPAESFGYIQRGAAVPGAQPAIAFHVERFHEKPRVEVARDYLATGGFYWNSGIFVFQAATILAELAAQQPALHRGLMTIARSIGKPDYAAVLEREFAALPRISIDRAVMEHAKKAIVIEAPFQWDDLGSWQALARLAGQDEHGNTVIGRHVSVRTQGTIVHSHETGHLVATVGLRDCLIVHTADATLVANKHDEEAIRQVVELLREKGWLAYL